MRYLLAISVVICFWLVIATTPKSVSVQVDSVDLLPVIWNRANSSMVWNDPVPIYCPENVPPNFAPDVYTYNPILTCVDCHPYPDVPE